MHEIRIPKSAIRNRVLPTRFNYSRDLALKRQVAKRYARNAKLAKVTARSSRLRTSVANTDRAPIAGHLLQQYHRRVDLFGRRSRIIDDLLRRLSTLCPQGDAFFTLFVFYYFADLCHIVYCTAETRRRRVFTETFSPSLRLCGFKFSTAGKAFPRISKAIVPDRRSSPS